MQKKIIPFVLVLLCFSLFSCKKSGEQLDKVVIQVPKTLSSIPLLELNGQEVAGVPLEVTFFQDHMITMAEFLNGSFPLLMTGFTQGMKNSQSSDRIVQVTCPVWGASSLITKNPAISTVRDLEKKRVLVPFAGSPLELQLKAILKHEGLEKKVIIDYAPVQQMIPLLLTGKADAICVPEPLASKLILGKQCSEVFTFPRKWGEITGGDMRSPQVSLFVKSGFAAKHGTFLKELIKDLQKSTTRIKAAPGETAARYAPVFELPEKVVERGLSNIVFEIPASATVKKLCRDYLQKIESTDSLDDSFFFEY